MAVFTIKSQGAEKESHAKVNSAGYKMDVNGRPYQFDQIYTIF